MGKLRQKKNNLLKGTKKMDKLAPEKSVSRAQPG